jgi:membrane-associated phospholipid phosphatase
MYPEFNPEVIMMAFRNFNIRRVVFFAGILWVFLSQEVTPTGKSFLSRTWPYFGLVAGGGVLLAFDKNLNRASQNNSLHNSTADQFSNTVEHFGRPGPFAVAVPALGAYGLIFKDRKSLLTAEELTAGFFLLQGVTGTAKSAFGRLRPYEADSPYEFFSGGSSFYSGHTVTIFTFATIISKNYPEQDLSAIGINHHFPLVPILTYAAGGMVGLQRLYDDDHWASDVYFGALAGYAIGSLTVYFGNKLNGPSLLVSPGSPPMLSATFHFN